MVEHPWVPTPPLGGWWSGHLQEPPPLLLLSLNPPQRTPPQVRKTTGDRHSTAVEMELGSHRLRLPIRTLAFLYKRNHV